MLRWIRNVMICVVLLANSLHGARVRPEELEALLEALNQPKAANVLRQEHDSGKI